MLTNRTEKRPPVCTSGLRAILHPSKIVISSTSIIVLTLARCLQTPPHGDALAFGQSFTSIEMDKGFAPSS